MTKGSFKTRETKGGPNAPVKAAPAEVLVMGQKTVAVAGTPERLHTAQELEAGVTIKALTGNGGSIFVGNELVESTNGYVLAADEAVFIEIIDLSLVWLNTDNATDGVSFIAS